MQRDAEAKFAGMVQLSEVKACVARESWRALKFLIDAQLSQSNINGETFPVSARSLPSCQGWPGRSTYSWVTATPCLQPAGQCLAMRKPA